jgi:glycosyltransferase involved in cell wall biosynthesis|tara:strand:- start:551 stop:1207 length:657 start_codon:yes stop_codon:yes gene_type:complete
MKISYGITVYNEHKELDNLLFHLSKHIRDEDEVVVTQDVSKKGTGVFEPEFQALEKVLEKYEYGNYFKNLKVTEFRFNKDFSKLKNHTKEHCSGDYIFHIDADEIPNEILIEQLPEILKMNEVDLVWVPRINIVNGITDFHLNLWRWRTTDDGWINFPDYQARIFRNSDEIKWVKPVHEHIDGCKTYSHLPPQEELTLKHEKDIKRQEVQNKLYEQII